MLMCMYVTAREKGRENEREPKKEWGGGQKEKEREGDFKFKLSSPSKAAGPEVLFLKYSNTDTSKCNVVL